MGQAMGQREFDIGERASRFGESVIDFADEIPTTPISNPLISQLVRAATSIGANLAEADESDTQGVSLPHESGPP